jgi:VWFA-related protein
MADNGLLLRDTVTRLLERLRGDDEVFVVQFGDEADFLSDFRTVEEIQAAIESERDAAKTAAEQAAAQAPAEPTPVQLPTAGGLLADYSIGGDRALFDAVALGLIRMRTARYDKKALILISAGDDSGSETSEADLARAAQREGVAINTLLLAQGLSRWRPGVEAEAPSAFLQRLAHQTGGLVALRPAVEERFGGLEGWLDRASTDLSDYIEHQYLLLFESYDPPPHGEWRDLSVRVAAVYERVRARSGYVR